MGKQRMIVGITGASGTVYGVRMLQLLRAAGIETHLVVSKAGDMTRAHETSLTRDDLRALADVAYDIHDVGAALSSGSFKTLGMVVAPCSVGTLAEIAVGTANTLLTRAADVCLKERRRLVLMVRETPLHLTHLRNMVAATEMGAIVCPPVPAFYAKPQALQDMVDHTVGRVLDLFGLDLPVVKRWEGLHEPYSLTYPSQGQSLEKIKAL
ncbi:MAG TPA: UbiX family flavin prenyltransferase [Candidatus Bathyarchaeia archaeon]|nr:UbiX family flavin prenyltransferase [Candidatus Bathyarchaeia archaeon]